MLSQIFNKEKTQSIIKVMPDTMIVWKIVTDWRYLKLNLYPRGMEKDHWHPAFSFKTGDRINWYPFKSGHNENNIWGFHCFVKKGEVQQYKKYFKNKYQIGYWNMLSATIEKKDIIKIGLDRGRSLTILTSQIVMPSYPNTDITKEFTESHNLIEDCEQAMELMSEDVSLADISAGK